MVAPAVMAGLALVEYVPTLLRLFGKDKPAEIVDKVSDLAKTVAGTHDVEGALKVIATNPEVQAQFVAEAEKRAMEWARLYIEDTQNARQRDIELAKAGIKNRRADALVTLASILVVGCLFVVVMMSDINEFAKGAITLILGRALGWIEQIFSFEFGTTRTSKSKDDVIGKLTK